MMGDFRVEGKGLDMGRKYTELGFEEGPQWERQLGGDKDMKNRVA